MHKIIHDSTLRMLESTFSKVFKSKDPFDDSFIESIEQKILFFPIDGYYLDEEQYNVLIQAVGHIGEDKYFICEIEGNCFSTSSSEDSYEHGHWLGTTSSTYADYIGIPLVLENAIYSLYGKWGVIVSHEGHAVVGGSKDFIEKIMALYPQYKACHQKFTEQWEYNQREYSSDIDWIRDFLKQFS